MVVAWILGIYASIIIILNLPFIQRQIADKVADILSEKIGTKVEIGSVNVGLLTRIIINDIKLTDKDNVTALKVGRVSASLDFANILKGQISLHSAQLFSANAKLYKKDVDSTLNIQYVIDAFSSNDTTKSSTPNIRVNTFIMRHANITYDIENLPVKKGLFDINHISVKNAGCNVSLKALSEDSLNVTLKHFYATELNSGLGIKDLSLKCQANKSMMEIQNFSLALKNSSVEIPEAKIHLKNKDKDKSFAIEDGITINGTVNPVDFQCLTTKDIIIFPTINLNAEIDGDDEKTEIRTLEITSDDHMLNLYFNGVIQNVMSDSLSLSGVIRDLFMDKELIGKTLGVLSVDEKTINTLSNLGDVRIQSELHYGTHTMAANGSVRTDAGEILFDAGCEDKEHITAKIQTGNDNIALGRILNEESLGDLALSAYADLHLVKDSKLPNGNVTIDVPLFTYNGYSYENINITADNSYENANAEINVDDENVKLNAVVGHTLSGKKRNVTLHAKVSDFTPYKLRLTDKYENERIAFQLHTQASGTDVDDINGDISVNDLIITTADSIFKLNKIDLSVEQQNNRYTNIILNSDFAEGHIKGYGHISSIVDDMTSIFASHLSEIVKTDNKKSDSNFTYDLSVKDSPILHHFINQEYKISHEAHIIGSIDVKKDIFNLNVDAPLFEYDGYKYRNVSLTCCNNKEQLSLVMNGLRHNDESAMRVNVNATCADNVIESNIKTKIKNKNDIDIDLNVLVNFKDSLGKTKTDIDINDVSLLINDTLWNISHSNISIFEKSISCHNLRLYSGNKFLSIEGTASPNPSDSLVAKLNNIEIEYILNIVNFTAVSFSGKATGDVTLHNLLIKPDFNANINVRDFCLQDKLLGNAQINGKWDDTVNGIRLSADIVNMYSCRDGLTDTYNQKFGITKVNGFVSPADNDIYLNVEAKDTHAKVLEGFLGIIFKDIDGYMRGTLNIVGPLNKIDLEGDVTGEMSMTLKTTNVPYMITGDTIHLQRGLISLDNLKILDKYGNIGLINGYVRHNYLKNFSYSIDADARSILAYDEKEFNADKFCATVFASGTVHVDGSDGHPLNISGNLSSTKGSVFSYDNVSPDALTNSSFIEFRDVTQHKNETTYEDVTDTKENDKTQSDDLSAYIIEKEKGKQNYEGDIYMDFHLNLNPNCEVRLRMDRMDDAYISVYGNGILEAKWHNKGSFQLFGTYTVDRGSYRLYMHDLVYRDLSISSGSQVVFNGNPFDAGIHLICNHEIHNVPLSDLVSTASYSQNNKTKVVCVLDISGTISSMDFKFDINLPNTNDETRQLVKSMITSEEEMNTQVIYLLAVNRFYPNDFARANGEDKSGQAVNSFVSSTLSGQINQMLSNIIGTNSNWNFGTGISTGERGWQDMDVEGILTGRLFDDRLIINGNFGYRDNTLTNTSSFIGDFEFMWRLWQNGNTYLKAYNQTNDRYFTKGTLNTQGLGISFQRDFSSFSDLFGLKKDNKDEDEKKKKDESNNKPDKTFVNDKNEIKEQ